MPVFAVCSGATLIEKHITLNRNDKGYDYYSALEPKEFKAMVDKIKQVTIALGNNSISQKERNYLINSSLRIVSSCNIKKGEMITPGKVSYKRSSSQNALLPFDAKRVLPGIATTDIGENSPILPEMIKKPTVGIVVICRLKSTRLPKKALKLINGVPSIERCLINCLAIPEVDHVVLATSHLQEDDPLEKMNINDQVLIVRGDPENVAERMLKAAEIANLDILVRITGDNPVVSPEIISLLIKEHINSGADFTQAREATIGTTGDIISTEALRRLVKHSNSLSYTEYLSFYFLNNPSVFSLNIIDLPQDLVNLAWRLTLDEESDLNLLESLYKDLNVKREPLLLKEVKEYFEKNPDAVNINKEIKVKWINDDDLVQEINLGTKLD